jgi:hypothetical protein
MCVTDDSTEALAGSCRAVVWSLLAWVSIVWPSKRPGGELGGGSEHGELLLDSEPWLLCFGGVEDTLGVVSEVSVGWSEFLAGGVSPSEGLAENEKMMVERVLGWPSEWVLVHGDWLHDDLGVLGDGLVAG